MKYVLGVLYIKQFRLFVLGTVSCFSELNTHCFNANKPQKELYYGICENSEWKKANVRTIRNEGFSCLDLKALRLTNFQTFYTGHIAKETTRLQYYTAVLQRM